MAQQLQRVKLPLEEFSAPAKNRENERNGDRCAAGETPDGFARWNLAGGGPCLLSCAGERANAANFDALPETRQLNN